MSAPRIPRIVVTHRIHAEVAERLAAHGELDLNPGPAPWSREDLALRLRHADAMLAFMTDRVDSALLAGAPRLRIVACALKGHDNFDAEACARAGVMLSFVPDLLTEPTAELAVGLAIAAGRRLREAEALVRSGAFAGWQAALYGTGLAGATVSVLGMGRVGRAIVDRLHGFGCARILGVDPVMRHPVARSVALADALSESTHLFLALPLTRETRGLFGAQAIAMCRPGQIVVNVGRGSVVDESAVARGLEDGRLGAYAADVHAFEDWALDDRPATVHPALLASDRTVLTPHVGSAVREVRLAIEHRAADNLIAALKGVTPPNLVPSPRRPPNAG